MQFEFIAKYNDWFVIHNEIIIFLLSLFKFRLITCSQYSITAWRRTFEQWKEIKVALLACHLGCAGHCWSINLLVLRKTQLITIVILNVRESSTNGITAIECHLHVTSRLLRTLHLTGAENRRKTRNNCNYDWNERIASNIRLETNWLRFNCYKSNHQFL